MPRIEMPRSKAEADSILALFMDYATQTSYRDIFLEAVRLKHGCSIEIHVDSSRRMVFFCTACNKEMNNCKSLSDHTASGVHLKNLNSHDSHSWSSNRMLERRKYCNLSFNELIKSTRLTVLGIQCITMYEDGPRTYHKCIACGAHGRSDAMYKHLIGDKHTDHYIRLRTNYRNSLISPKEREMLREKISVADSVEGYTYKIIKGPHLYPHKWENHNRSTKAAQFKQILPIPHFPIKKERIRDDYEASSPKNRKDSEVRAISIGCLENILFKLQVLIMTHPFKDLEIYILDKTEESSSLLKKYVIKECDLNSENDLKACVQLLNACLTMQCYTVRAKLKMNKDDSLVESQKVSLEKVLGYLNGNIPDHLLKRDLMCSSSSHNWELLRKLIKLISSQK